jgi:hypothetical protein
MTVLFLAADTYSLLLDCLKKHSPVAIQNDDKKVLKGLL